MSNNAHHSQVGELPSLDSFSVGVYWEAPIVDARGGLGARGGGAARGGRGGRGAIAQNETVERGLAGEHQKDFDGFCESVLALPQLTSTTTSGQGPTEAGLPHVESSRVVELADFSNKSARHRCFLVRQVMTTSASVSSHRHLFLRCLVTASPSASPLSHTFGCMDAVMIAASSLDAELAALHEAFTAFYNSNGLRCGVIYVLKCMHSSSSPSSTCNGEDIVTLLKDNFAAAAQRLGGVYPALRIVTRCSTAGSSRPGGQQDSRRWAADALNKCISDLTGEHRALRQRIQQPQGRSLPRKPPAAPPRPSSTNGASSLGYPYDTLDREGTNASLACRVYIIGKDTPGRRLHVVVLGGVLQAGCRLIVPHPHGEDGGYLTVSTVERWGDAQLPTGTTAATTPTADAAALPSEAASKRQTHFGIGSVCSINFRQLSTSRLSWGEVPVDVLAGSGMVTCHRLMAATTTHCHGAPTHTTTAPSTARPDVWCDGMFPKRPLCVALYASSVAQEQVLLQHCSLGTTKSAAAPITSTADLSAVAGGGAVSPSPANASVLYLSLDSQTFFEVASVALLASARGDATPPALQFALVLKSAAPRCVQQLRLQHGLGGRAARPERRSTPCSTSHGNIPMRPLVARLVQVDDASASRTPPQAHPSRSIQATTVKDPFRHYEYAAVVGVQGAGYYLDCVVQCCSWLDRANSAILNNATASLLVDKSIPLRLTSDGAAHLAAPHHSLRTIGNELRCSAAPFCDGKGAYAFLLHTFVIGAGCGGGGDQGAAPAPSTPSTHQATETLQGASFGLIGNDGSAATSSMTTSLTAAMGKNPFFARWGQHFLVPIVSSMTDLVGRSIDSLNHQQRVNARTAKSRVLDHFPLELMDHILELMSPFDIPREALPTAAPLLLYRIMESFCPMGQAPPKAPAANKQRNPGSNNGDELCSVELKRQHFIAQVLVDRCFDARITFHSTLSDMLRTKLSNQHSKYTWAVSASRPAEGPGSFYKRLVTCITPSMALKDIVPSNVHWGSCATTNGNKVLTLRPPAQLIPAEWRGVCAVVRMYEMAKMKSIKDNTVVSNHVSAPWGAFLVSDVFKAEAFMESAPAKIGSNAVLFALIMSYCFQWE